MPNSLPRRKYDATLALWMMFLLGKHAMFGHDPPMYLRSTTATRFPSSAKVHAAIVDPVPPPRISRSKFSTCDCLDISADEAFFALFMLIPSRKLLHCESANAELCGQAACPIRGTWPDTFLSSCYCCVRSCAMATEDSGWNWNGGTQQIGLALRHHCREGPAAKLGKRCRADGDLIRRFGERGKWRVSSSKRRRHRRTPCGGIGLIILPVWPSKNLNVPFSWRTRAEPFAPRPEPKTPVGGAAVAVMTPKLGPPEKLVFGFRKFG